jgi:hypothetical protein
MPCVQRTGQINKLLRLVATVKNWRCAVALLLLAAALAARADDQLPASEKVLLTAVQEQQKESQRLERRDLLLFFHEDLGPHNHSNAWFSVRADYYEFAFNDQFTRREEPGVAGIKAVFSF